MSNGDAPKQDVSVLALERTVLAGERTLLALAALLVCYLVALFTTDI